MSHYTAYRSTQLIDAPRSRGAAGVPGWRRMVAILFFVTVVVSLLLLVKPTPAAGPSLPPLANVEGDQPVAAVAAVPASESAASARPQQAIATFFTPEVQGWAPEIVQWAEAHNLDPNAVATIMQIESCGDPRAVSSAGARGLFQVMPFHFAAGEDPFDPDTNARRGLTYYAERLEQTSGDVGRAFAGYNGGQRAAAGKWEQWPAETQRYYVWSTGIYEDARKGATASPTLEAWLGAGGSSLCRQAAARLEGDG